MSIPPEHTVAVWQRSEHFPRKPDGAPYGFVFERQAYGFSSLAELQHTLSQHESQGKIHYFWNPQQDHLVLTEEFPELLETIKPGRIARATQSFHDARYKLIIFSIILAVIMLPEFKKYGLSFYQSPMFGFYFVLFLMFILIPCYEQWKRLKNVIKLDVQRLQDEAAEIRFDLWTANQPSYFTKALLAVLIGIFILQFLAPSFTDLVRFDDSLQLAGLRKELIQAGEGWRLWTAPFLHGGPVHLFMNASGLWYIGRRVEVLTSWPHLLCSYLVSILVGSYCSLAFIEAGRTGIGASGGIMGLLGFLLVFEILHPKLAPRPARRRLVAGIILMAVIGLAGFQFIDNAAHAGGLLAGMAYGYLGFKKSDSVYRPKLSNVDLAIGAVSLVIIVLTAIFTVGKII